MDDIELRTAITESTVPVPACSAQRREIDFDDFSAADPSGTSAPLGRRMTNSGARVARRGAGRAHDCRAGAKRHRPSRA